MRERERERERERRKFGVVIVSIPEKRVGGVHTVRREQSSKGKWIFMVI